MTDPSAPEWQQHLEWFTNLWHKLLQKQTERGFRLHTITPEFGDVPYLPTLPYTRQPLANQWSINFNLKKYLQAHL